MSKLIVSISPHLRDKSSTQSIMRDVIIALCPAVIAGTVIFGLRALAVVAVTIASAVISEALIQRKLGRAVTLSDLSAVVTGLILALNLPVSIPLWQAAVGAIFAIVVVKQLFGGLGHNFANPAIVGRVMMIIAFSGTMAAACSPTIVDTVAGATPLAVIGGSEGTLPSNGMMFLGVCGGALGETSALALLLGGAYLLIRRVISWHLPVAFIGTVFVFSFLVGRDPVYEILSGGLMLGAFFMATDYVTSPSRWSGKLIFGVGCGLITMLIRVWGNYPEGVSFSILLMNILTPYIEKWTRNQVLGGVKV